MIIPYKPSEISQLDVDILQELILSNRSFGISKKNPSLKIRFLEALPEILVSGPGSFFLNINQQPAELTLVSALNSSLADRLKELGGVESVPEEFRSAMIALSAREVIDSLEVLLQEPIALWDEAKSKTSDVEQKTLFFEVINNDFIEAHGTLTLSTALVEKIISLAFKLPCMEAPVLAPLLLEGELVIASMKLSLDEWHHLTAGAFLFFDEFSAILTGKGNFLLKNGKMIPLSFDQEQLKLLIVPLTKIIPSSFMPAKVLSEAEQSEGFEKKKSAIKQEVITVELAFSVGSISLSIDQIINLASKASLADSMKVSQPLKILEQGNLVGVGELVEINNQHAIFVKQLY